MFLCSKQLLSLSPAPLLRTSSRFVVDYANRAALTYRVRPTGRLSACGVVFFSLRSRSKRLQIADNPQISSVKLCASVFDSSLWAPTIDRSCALGPSIRLQSISDTDGSKPATNRMGTSRAPYLPPSPSLYLTLFLRFSLSLAVYMSLSFYDQSDQSGSGRLCRSPARVVSRQNKYILRIVEFVFSLLATKSVHLSLRLTWKTCRKSFNVPVLLPFDYCAALQCLTHFSSVFPK